MNPLRERVDSGEDLVELIKELGIVYLVDGIGTDRGAPFNAVRRFIWDASKQRVRHNYMVGTDPLSGDLYWSIEKQRSYEITAELLSATLKSTEFIFKDEGVLKKFLRVLPKSSTEIKKGRKEDE